MTGPRTRPRRRWPAFVVVAVWLSAGAVWGAAFIVDTGSPAGDAAAAAGVPESPARPDPAAPPASPDPALVAAAPKLPVVAHAGSIDLRAVSAEVVAVAFHEASYSDALDLVPAGRCVVCRNRWKFRPPPMEPGAELKYIVMDTRGRAAGATSAADAVLPRGADVLAPVSGTVTAVRSYRLYGRYWDVRVQVRPERTVGRRVVVLHLKGVTLVRGDHVEASVTRLGTVRRFPFESQVDRYVPGRLPHVHMEVKRPAPRAPDARSKV